MEKYYPIIGALIVGLVVGFFAGRGLPQGQLGEISSTPTSVATEGVNIQLVNHIQAKLPEQDVFIESDTDSNMVVRVEGEAANEAETAAKNVFASSEAVPHDPFKVGENPLGPFPKGESLGFTLADWLAGTGSGTYTVDGEAAQIDLTLEKLVPNATYTVWCSRLTFPPNPAVVDKPCGAEDGSENVFNTDTNGGGTFSVKLKPLEESTKETASVIALSYHSDGKTYGAIPGDFGLNSHVQLFFLVPEPAQ